MSNNWIMQNFQNALITWNGKLSEIWLLITQSPETFKGGTIWSVKLSEHMGQAHRMDLPQKGGALRVG